MKKKAFEKDPWRESTASKGTSDPQKKRVPDDRRVGACLSARICGSQ